MMDKFERLSKTTPIIANLRLNGQQHDVIMQVLELLDTIAYEQGRLDALKEQRDKLQTKLKGETP